MKISECEKRVLEQVGDHFHLSELAIGTLCAPSQDDWDESRRRELGRAVAESMRVHGLLQPSDSPGYWKVAE
jgi:hypothetical protein